MRVWDVVAGEQALKGEYRVLSGRMYVWSLSLRSRLRALIARFGLICGDVATTLRGTARVSASSPSVTERKSAYCAAYCVRAGADARVVYRFGHAFMMDSGSSTGEIIGHSKVRACGARAAIQRWGVADDAGVQVINAVAIRHQRPFRAATAGDDTAIIFHTGAPYKYERVRWLVLTI